MRGVDKGGRICGDKRQHRNKSGPPWHESQRKLIGGGNRERESNSGRQRGVVIQRWDSECSDGDRRRPCGRMT